MFKKAYNLEGKKFGHLTVISRHGTNNHKLSTWNCLCECGEELVVIGCSLTNGNTKSCGCLHKMGLIKMSTVHGLGKHPLYGIWSNIKTRCYNANTLQYHNYGGKGVIMCEEWKNDFKSFYDWAITNGWQKGLQIDKDIKGNGFLYSPETCCIVTPSKNCNNKTNNWILEFNNSQWSATELAKKFNIPYSLFVSRLRRGWTIQQALFTKKMQNKYSNRQPEIRHAFGFIG